LPEKTQHLVYHLIQSGLYGRDIIFDQNSTYNLVVKRVVERTVDKILLLSDDDKNEFSENFLNYARLFWAHNGIHNDRSAQKHKIDFTEAEYRGFKLSHKVKVSDREFDVALSAMFDETVEQVSIANDKNKDLVADSGMNFYCDGLTVDLVNPFEDENYPKEDNHPPRFGINSRLALSKDGQVTEEKWRVGGRCSYVMGKILKMRSTR